MVCINRKDEVEFLLLDLGKWVESKIYTVIEEYVTLIDNATDEKAKRSLQTVPPIINLTMYNYSFIGSLLDSKGLRGNNFH